MYLASRTSVLGLGRVIVVGAVGLGLAMIVLASIQLPGPVSIVALLVAGAHRC